MALTSLLMELRKLLPSTFRSFALMLFLRSAVDSCCKLVKPFCAKDLRTNSTAFVEITKAK